MKVSKFENIFTKQVEHTELKDELSDIKNGKYQNIITKCRYLTGTKNYDAYKALKIKLPIVTFCGTFQNGRKLENLHRYNNLMIIDIDDIEKSDILEIKEKLKNDKFIYSTWLSPSGEGLKALVRINSSPEEHKSSFSSLKEYFKKEHNIELDTSGSDVTRLCFVSWDEELYLSPNAEIYKGKLKQLSTSSDAKTSRIPISKSLIKSAYATEGLNKQEHRKNISLIIKFLRRNEISITDTFDKWFRVALAISSSFSYDLGEKYFLNICELDKEKHSELESKNILKYCYNNRDLSLPTSISFGTIFFYAKQKGFITKKDKFSE